MEKEQVMTQTTETPNNQIIGFANTFYTLWSFRNDSSYFTDAYGNHHLQSIKTTYDFIKNISTDLDKVKALYPNLSIDDSLRGKSSSWSEKKEVDETPANIFTFGKYCGKSIEDVSEFDFNYLLWVKDNCYKQSTKEAILNLPKMIAHLEKEEADKKAFQDAMIIAQDGEVEIEFITNPNYLGETNFFITDKTNVIGNVPASIKWESVNELTNPKNKQWFRLEKGISSKTGIEYEILHYDANGNHENPVTFSNSFEYNPSNTIEEARNKAEIQDIINAHEDICKYYIVNEFTPLLKKYYAEAFIIHNGERLEDSRINIFFDDIKQVLGKYPYNMAIINGKAMKIKGKKMTLPLQILHTNKGVKASLQIAIIK